MNPQQLVALLGRPSTDPAVERSLVGLRISRRPEVVRDEEDVDGPVVETRDWLINRRVGIEFGFEDEASFFGRSGAQYGVGPMLLTQLYFYGVHPEVKPYGGPFPLGLLADDDRQAVRKKFTKWEKTRRSYFRDTWELPAFRVTVSYVDDGKRIGFVLFMLRRPTKPLFDDDLATLPTTDQILSVLGKPLNDRALRLVFARLGVDQHLVDRGNERIADFREAFGLELQFRDRPGVMGSSVLTNALFYRDHEMNATGWPGALPLALTFDDSPEVMLLRIGLPPESLHDETFEGVALWHLPDYSIQVTYSLMENWIRSVHVMAPGVWDAD
jgi:hypothetical protein